MARVTIERNLPPLRELLKRLPDFPPGRSHQSVIANALREVARLLKTTHSQPFYAMREVADSFNAPLSNVARVYKILEHEGIVNRIRSSQTVLVGKKTSARSTVRGVVGIPILMDAMMNLDYTRSMAMALGEGLRRWGYVADIIFYSAKEEENSPEFARRLLWYRLDAVVLHSPLPGCRENILFLRERAVRVFVIQWKEDRCDLPAMIYLEDFQVAYKEMARRWRARGIRKVYLWSKPSYLTHHPHRVEADKLVASLRQKNLSVEFISGDLHDLTKKLRERRRPVSTGLAFLSDPLGLAARTEGKLAYKTDADLMGELSQHFRLAFICQTDLINYIHARNIPADWVEFPPSEIAFRLVKDITRLALLTDGVQHTFPAVFHGYPSG